MLRCSFCRKTEDEVSKLVAGPDVYICNECVRLAVRLMREPGLFTRLWRLLRSLRLLRMARTELIVKYIHGYRITETRVGAGDTGIPVHRRSFGAHVPCTGQCCGGDGRTRRLA